MLEEIVEGIVTEEVVGEPIYCPNRTDKVICHMHQNYIRNVIHHTHCFLSGCKISVIYQYLLKLAQPEK